MSEMLNPDHFDAPYIEFGDLPEGMGEKLEVGDTIIARQGDEETAAEVIDIDKAGGCAYLSKELPKDADYSVMETSTGDSSKYDAIKKGAATSDVLTGPLPKLRNFLIQISIKEGE